MSRREQRETSRRRLLDATFSCLVDHGYAGTTTSAITAKAGLSSGALFNHFATKDELLTAMIADVLPRLMENTMVELSAEVAVTPRPAAAIVNVLWDALQSPTMQVLYELYVAARTNAPLQAALAEIAPFYREAVLGFANELFPGLAEWDRLNGFIGLLVSCVQGAAVTELAFGVGFPFAQTKDLLTDTIEELLAEGHASVGIT
jgi:AcrR family transcriptional regulator